MNKEFAGNDLHEILDALRDDGFREMHEDRGSQGFDLWKPWGDLPQYECSHVVVWPREQGGYWSEEY